MNIRGLGDKLVDHLVDHRIVKTPADLYTLSATALADMERMAEKSASNVVRCYRKEQKHHPGAIYLFAGYSQCR